ncbi:P-loop containing nucleoside triphosphate hydrolase protein [Ramicandelaber brevisporus]|nr:P-loop containing nucleoside triphosphate hydrolase protein [Ramicandelaber brevisporus]
MSDLFKLLGAGARFDRSRFANDIETVTQQSVPGSGKRGNAVSRSGASSRGENDTKRKKRKTADSDSDSDSDKDDSNDDNSGSENDDDPDVDASGDEEDMAPFEAGEMLSRFRSEHGIHVYGTDVPFPVRSFAMLLKVYSFPDFLRQQVQAIGFKTPTPIQMQATPIILAKRDLISCSPTGSGKTLAFALPILRSLEAPAKVGYRAVVVAPTKELATQIYNLFLALTIGRKFKICHLTKATASTQEHDEQVRQKFDILVTTPMRLVHALKTGGISLANVQHLVLDEADRLLDMGFLEQVDEIVSACTLPSVQKSLFSATIPSSVEDMAKSIMRDPIRIVIGAKNAASENITQRLVFTGSEDGKLLTLRQFVQQGGVKPPCLIFVQSIERAKELYKELVYDGINVDVIHAERTQQQRNTIIENFRQGKLWVLIATDLMARGIDFKGVNLVINYDFPQTAAAYTHRIGRTGRAGRKGEAITYFTKQDAPYLKIVVNVMRESGCDVPEWMLELKGPTRQQKKMLKKKGAERKSISTLTNYDKGKRAKKRQIVSQSKQKKHEDDASDSE